MDAVEISNYRDHLVKSFSVIKNNQMVRRDCASISEYSGKISDLLKGFKNPHSWKLNIDPPWIIPIENDERYFERDQASLLLSGVLSVENSLLQMYTFVSSIILKSQGEGNAITQIPLEEYCEHKHIYKDRLIRRFHFDLAIGGEECSKPISHFQFGGKEIYNQYSYTLNPRIGIPRFPYPPVDFIILFDMMLRQFKTKIPSSFYDSKDWVHCVKQSENFRLKCYYEIIQRYFNPNTRTRKTLSGMFTQKEFFQAIL
jgi:hypothetical protein